MWRQTVNFSANRISWILLLPNERARKVIDNDSVRFIKIQFFFHFSPPFPLHQALPAWPFYFVIVNNKLMSVFWVCPLIDDYFRHNIVKISSYTFFHFSFLFSFVKNRSCLTQICIKKIAAKCILVVVVYWCDHADVLLGRPRCHSFDNQQRRP